MSWITDLRRKEFKVYSQHGEDGITLSILKEIGVYSGICAEIGSGPDGSENCTRILAEIGRWDATWIDKASNSPRVLQKLATIENVNSMLPECADVLSIDVDGMDYWLWRAIKQTPRLVIIEYNSAIPFHLSMTVPYKPEFVWQRDNRHGASIGALVALAHRKGYELVYCDSSGVNAFFVRKDRLEIEPPTPKELFVARRFDFGWKNDRDWERVEENGEPNGLIVEFPVEE